MTAATPDSAAPHAHAQLNGRWWLQVDGVPPGMLQRDVRDFLRPFTRRRVWEGRLVLAIYPALLLALWAIQVRYWWITGSVCAVIGIEMSLVRLDVRRCRQLLSLLPPDPPDH
jgi:hypothetical protein